MQLCKGLTDYWESENLKAVKFNNKRLNIMDKILKILANYTTPRDYNLFHDTIDEVCSNGIAKGFYQDYAVLSDVLTILTDCDTCMKNACQTD